MRARRRRAGAVVVDQGFAFGSGGDESGDGGHVESAGQAVGETVETGDGVVGEQGVGAASEGEVVLEVVGGLGEIHRGQAVADANPLVERRVHPEAELPGQGGLTDQEAGEGRLRVHLGIGQEPELLELVGTQKMRLIKDEDDATVSFGLFGGEQVLDLGQDLGLVEAGAGAEGGDDGVVEAAGAGEGGVGDLCG